MIDSKHKYLVVSGALWHEGYVDQVEAVDAAFRMRNEGTKTRVLLIVHEIDLSEWEQCPVCGAAVEKGIWCWASPECIAEHSP